MKRKNKKIDSTAKTVKSTNRLVKFWVITGSVLAVFGVAGAGVSFLQHRLQEKALEKVYTVEFDLEADSMKGKRLDDAVGMAAGINGAKNDFDNAYPWKAIKDVEDENGDIFVRIPKFYVKNTLSENKLTFSISPAARKGYHVAPAFVRTENGEEVVSDYIDIGKYEASLTEDNHLKSVSGVYPMADELNLGEARAIAEADGNELFDWRQNLALQELFIVEFADPDSQGLMSGLSQGLYYKHVLTAEEIGAKKLKTIPVEFTGANLMDNTMDKIKFIKANTGRVDIQMEHPAADEEEEDFEYKASNLKASGIKLNEAGTDIVSVTLEKELNVEKMEAGEEINIWFGAGFYHKTGETDNEKGSSNGASQKSNEVKAMNYRGIENWYGNTFTIVDGLFTNHENDTNNIYVSQNPKNNGNSETYELLTSEFTEKELAFYEFDNTSEDEPWLYDYYNFTFDNETTMVGGIGGGYDRNADSGIFCIGVHFALETQQASFRIASTK